MLKDWRISDRADGRLELVGTRVDDRGAGEAGAFHTGPVLGIVGLRLILAESGAIYRLLPQAADRRMDPESLERLGPAAWREMARSRVGAR
jgi:hypothetical protein